MEVTGLSNRQRVSIGVLLLLSAFCIVGLWKLALDSRLGKDDFIGYWSATYLLHEGRNSYDPAGMGEVQQTLVHSNFDYIVQAWNPPTLMVFTLPLAWLSFDAARATWVVVNVAILLIVSFMLARLYLPEGRRAFVVFCLFVILFPQALVAVTMGQVTFLVLLGVVSSLLLIKREQWFWAGAFLILTTVKPHMVVLTVPYLLLSLAYRRRWQAWLGLLCAGLLCVVILTVFRPLWVTDFMGLLKIAPVNWATPTIGGIVSSLHLTEGIRYLIVLFLPLAWVLARPQTRMNVETGVALLTIVTVPATFFGWSYDQSILLIPIAQVFGWLLRSSTNATKIGVIVAILISVLLNWIQRIITTSDMYYLWIPLFWAVVYCVCAVGLRNKDQTMQEGQDEIIQKGSLSSAPYSQT